MPVPAVAAGTRIGSYVILEPLGSGGRGAVYRARDTKLGRPVALKLLHSHFDTIPGEMARFQREAQLLASMNHPGIASIHGLEECDGIQALAMELVDGPTLAERLASGQMSLEEKLRIAKLMAEALDYAHKKGVVHRDLKPANVKLTPNGQVKLLDFGLAKSLTDRILEQPEESDLTRTQTGIIKGTFAYMSPEQAQAKELDQRTDIWAFGAILYEMLAGRRAMAGATASDVIVSLLKEDPDWEHLPCDTPMAVRDLVQRCLRKDPDLRLRDIGEASGAIQCCLACRTGVWPLVSGAARPVEKKVARVPRWGIAAWLVIAVAVGFLEWWHTRPSPPTVPLLRFSVDIGSAGLANSGYGPGAVVSPDGTRLIFCSLGRDGKQRLSMRLLDQEQIAELPSTEDAHDPFFSPDGQWVAFLASGKLKKLSLHGGPPLVLCDVPDGRGGSWGDDGSIVLARTTRGGLSRLPAAGGPPQTITQVDLSRREKTHRWPQVLPGADAVIFTAHSTIGNFDAASVEAQSLLTGKRRTLRRNAYFGRYLPSGHLLYLYQGTLYGMRIDLKRLEPSGEPVALLQGVACDPNSGGAQFDFSESRMLIYRSGAATGARWTISWLNRTGATQPLRSTPAVYLGPRLSPDGTRVATGILGAGGYDIWVYAWQRDRMTRLTMTSGFDGYPVWTPDGRLIAFESDRAGGIGNLYLMRADGAGEPLRLTHSKNPQSPGSFSPDGTRLAFCQFNPETGFDEIWILPLTRSASGEPTPGRAEVFLRAPVTLATPMFSRDGRWLAYASDESGTTEVYVRPYPGPGGGWQISSGGGTAPAWSRTERAIFFKTPDRRIMVAPYSIEGNSFVCGNPRLWSEKPLPDSQLGQDFDLAPDGKHLAVLAASEQEPTPQRLVFLLNFFDELKRRIP